jgi:membrane-associated HD superfamily phosphohydrolase
MIFLKGSMILLPFGLLLLTGLFEAEPFMRYLILLADLALIALLIFSYKPKTYLKLKVEMLSYIVLLLPLVRVFVSFPFNQFDYFLFIFPTLTFIILFPLSIFLSYKNRKQINHR